MAFHILFLHWRRRFSLEALGSFALSTWLLPSSWVDEEEEGAAHTSSSAGNALSSALAACVHANVQHVQVAFFFKGWQQSLSGYSHKAPGTEEQ